MRKAARTHTCLVGETERKVRIKQREEIKKRKEKKRGGRRRRYEMVFKWESLVRL